jgi:hypothetical protein
MLARPMGSLIIQPLRLNVRMQAGGGKGKGMIYMFLHYCYFSRYKSAPTLRFIPRNCC